MNMEELAKSLNILAKGMQKDKNAPYRPYAGLEGEKLQALVTRIDAFEKLRADFILAKANKSRMRRIKEHHRGLARMHINKLRGALRSQFRNDIPLLTTMGLIPRYETVDPPGGRPPVGQPADEESTMAEVQTTETPALEEADTLTDPSSEPAASEEETSGVTLEDTPSGDAGEQERNRRVVRQSESEDSQLERWTMTIQNLGELQSGYLETLATLGWDADRIAQAEQAVQDFSDGLAKVVEADQNHDRLKQQRDNTFIELRKWYLHVSGQIRDFVAHLHPGDPDKVLRGLGLKALDSPSKELETERPEEAEPTGDGEQSPSPAA
jgi:hypothetical protein